jgi:hypothetical protein
MYICLYRYDLLVWCTYRSIGRRLLFSYEEYTTLRGSIKTYIRKAVVSLSIIFIRLETILLFKARVIYQKALSSNAFPYDGAI